jgi:hypothetical protein
VISKQLCDLRAFSFDALQVQLTANGLTNPGIEVRQLLTPGARTSTTGLRVLTSTTGISRTSRLLARAVGLLRQ